MARRRYQWVGGSKSQEPATDASSGLSTIMEMVPAELLATQVGPNTQCVIEAIYLHFSIHRLLITEVDALGFIVWTANVVEGGDTPVQTLDALSLAPRAYGNKNIMMMAPLPFPGIFLSSDLLSATVTEEGLVAHHEYQASRKLDRSNQVLALQVNSDVSAVFNVFAQWRVLLSYGQK